MSFRLSQYVGSGYPETRSTTMVPTEFFLVLLEVYKIGRVTYSRYSFSTIAINYFIFSVLE